MKRMLCFGDSNTWGYIPGTGGRYNEDIRWTARLQAALPGWRVAEEGLNCRTTVFYAPEEQYICGLYYARTCVLSQIPLDLIVIMLGTNDAKVRYAASAHDITAGMERLCAEMLGCCSEKGSYPGLILISPVRLMPRADEPDFNADSAAKIIELETLYEELAAKKGYIFIKGSDAVKDIGPDGIHMTPQGHRALSGFLAQKIAALPTA